MRRRRRRTKKKVVLTADQLLARASRSIAAGDGKSAVSLLKRARFRGARPDRTGPLFVRAYMLLAEELDSSGLGEQAQDARRRAAEYRAAPALAGVNASNVLERVRSASDEDGFRLYAHYLKSHPPDPAAEVELANRVVLRGCSQHLRAMDPECAFRRDAELFASARPSLDRGAWGEGSKLLRPLAAASGFAQWRTFSVAMGAYQRGDRTLVGNAVRKLPRSFPLRGSFRFLSASIRNSVTFPIGVPSRLAKRLQQLSSDNRSLFQDLRSAVENESAPSIARSIRRLAAALYPSDPERMTHSLAFSLQPDVLDEELDIDTLTGMFDHLMTSRMNDMMFMIVSIRFLDFPGSAHSKLSPMELCFESFEQYIPDTEDRRIARSLLYLRLARLVRDLHHTEVDTEVLALVRSLVGKQYKPLRSKLQAATALYRASVKEDPENVETHKDLIRTLDYSAAPRSDRVAAFEAYAKAFPRDTDPWIKLAEFRLQHNAYRKAEQALKKASAQAGQDQRVTDLLVVASIYAAYRNIRNRRLELAERDIKAAESRPSPQAEGLVRAAKALLKTARHKRTNPVPACKEIANECRPSLQVQALCLVLIALQQGTLQIRASKLGMIRLRTLVSSALLAVCKDSPSDLPELVQDLPKSFRSIVHANSIVPQIEGYWAEILAAVPNSSMLGICLIAFEYRAWKTLKQELKRRLARARTKEQIQVILLFLAAVKYLLREDRDSVSFARLKRALPEDRRRVIRQVSSQLSEAIAKSDNHGYGFRHTSIDLLVEALRHFDFEILDYRIFG